MNWKAWAPLIVAVLLGAVALFVAKDAIRKNRSPETSKGHFSHVVIAKRAITAGQELTAEDLAMGPISDDQTPEGTFASTRELLGRVVVSPMVKGQPVMTAFLANPGALGGLQALVPEGMRAVTLEINEFSGVAGFLKTGSRVDVVTSLRESASNEPVAVTVVKDVVVQAVGQYTGSQVGNAADAAAGAMPRSVTLVVTPEQAETIELATTIGRVRLTLRGNGDRGDVNSTGVTTAFLRTGNRKDSTAGIDPFVIPVEQIKRSTTAPATDSFIQTRDVTIIRGGQQSTVSFEIPRPKGLFTDAPTNR